MSKTDEQSAPRLVAELLEEQRLLTAVARFSQKHRDAQAPLQSRYYRDLIPLERPAPGEQYAFQVDLDKCSGCKACVAACHSLNGLEEDESWRSVGLLVGHGEEFQQTVTSACHHCAEPACLEGCPVDAYEKDSITGIVHHLDDQCIGCQYCVLKCPYEVPRYSARLGIVRKCDMCSGRLQAGEAPACVQSCPSQAIQITTVNLAEGRARLEAGSGGNPFLPGSPDPNYTLPTTIYRSAKPLSQALAPADAQHLEPAQPHWPLVFMLALTQGAAGLLWAQSWRFISLPSVPPVSPAFLGAMSAFTFAGLAVSILHLGRPLQAWRAFIGVGRSWLSREIVMFGAFASSVLLVLAGEVLPPLFPGVWPELPWHTASLAGLLALLCSVMVYHDTPRPFWHARRTLPQFLGGAILTGCAGGVLFLENTAALLLPLCLTGILKLLVFAGLLAPVASPEFTPLKRSAILLRHQLAPWTGARIAFLLIGGILLPAWFMAKDSSPALSWSLAGFAFIMAGEMIERSLFFRAVSQPKMPGGLP